MAAGHDMTPKLCLLFPHNLQPIHTVPAGAAPACLFVIERITCGEGEARPGVVLIQATMTGSQVVE